MLRLGCLWNRSRLERYVDGALGNHSARRVESHLAHCPACLARTESARRIRVLVHAASPDPVQPDWSGFWPVVHARILRERPKPVRDAWWLPLWSPFWGHPRIAVGGVVAAGLILTLSLWPASDNQSSVAWAGPVVVQDVSTPDPDRSVMVYSVPDQALTVIWLFSADGSPDES
jgi:anti-sigma factor RsiW